jgi:hypothetical protein
MARSEALTLNDCRSFTRGYLLACDWAGRRPESAVGERIPRLAGEGTPALYDSFRLLPRTSREALRITWSKRERRCRLDELVGLHPSWLTDHLGDESAASLLVALGEINPDLGREVLRALWPRLKPCAGEEVEVRPLAPAWSGELRRWIFRRFVHAAPSPTRDHPLDRLASLDPQQVWLFAQDLGRDELRRVAEAAPSEVDSLLRRLPHDQAVQLGRLLAAMQNGVEPEGTTDTMQISLDPVPQVRRDEVDAGGFHAAAEHIRAVFEVAEIDANILGSIGLRSLAAALAAYPRTYALQLAQRMGLPLATRMLAWRDDFEVRDAASPPARSAEILHKAGRLKADRELRGDVP